MKPLLRDQTEVGVNNKQYEIGQMKVSKKEVPLIYLKRQSDNLILLSLHKSKSMAGQILEISARMARDSGADPKKLDGIKRSVRQVVKSL